MSNLIQMTRPQKSSRFVRVLPGSPSKRRRIRDAALDLMLYFLRYDGRVMSVKTRRGLSLIQPNAKKRGLSPFQHLAVEAAAFGD